MIKRSRSSLGCTPITGWSVMHWASTPRGMQCPPHKKTAGTFRPLEHGLDELFSHLVSGIRDPRVFLKMDTQGYDLEVFKGARSSIRNILGLQSELSVRPLYHGMPHYLEALSVYEDAGFELFDLTVVTRTSEGGLQELNCFMKRRNS